MTDQFRNATKMVPDHLAAPGKPMPEPFGYFKAEPFGWTDCAETDEGAKPLFDWDTVQDLLQQIEALEDGDALLRKMDVIFHGQERYAGGYDAILKQALAEVDTLHVELDATERQVNILTDDLNKVHQAVKKLHAAKGRYHTQLAACDLFDLVGLPNERPKK